MDLLCAAVVRRIMYLLNQGYTCRYNTEPPGQSRSTPRVKGDAKSFWESSLRRAEIPLPSYSDPRDILCVRLVAAQNRTESALK